MSRSAQERRPAYVTYEVVAQPQPTEEPRGVDQFLRILAHDLRNPLSVARTSAQMAARLIQRGDLDGAQKRLDAIVAQADRAGALVDEFVEAARVSSNTVVLRSEEADMAELVKAAEEMARIQVGELADRAVELRLLQGCAGTWDKRQITRTLAALVKNAYLYGDSATPLRIEMRRRDRTILVRVSGGGHGPSEAESSQLFQPFFRGEAAAQVGRGGAGLGLYIARGVARASGGDVRQSPDLSADTFELELPLGTPNG